MNFSSVGYFIAYFSLELITRPQLAAAASSSFESIISMRPKESLT